jgi:hypothetical protein
VSATAEQVEQVDYEQALVERLYDYRHDPLGCVLYSFPWGEEGTELADDPGPRKFQRRFLDQLGQHLRNPETRFKPFRKAVSSGHGIGKSALIGQVVHWAKSTCLDCKVLITANTGDQLKSKTQPEISKWFRLAINKDWFDVHVTSIKINDAEHENSWRTDFATWSEDNPQAFAGAHNKGKRLVIIFDEAGEISDEIYKTVEGALTDAKTEIIWLLFSQCTRASGAFYEAVFGDQRGRWNPEYIDSRDVEGTNVEEINESINFYGLDSSHVRVRYLGLPPHSDEGQYIDRRLIDEARKRIPRALPDDPLIAGCDAAWGGSDKNVIRFRRGLDAQSVPPIKIPGELTRDPAILTNRLADILSRNFDGRRVAMLFVDSAGIAGPVVRRLREMGYQNVMEVNFGADSPDMHFAYMRDYMWGTMKQWLIDGGAIDQDKELALDLAGPLLVPDLKQRVKLEPKEKMKARGIDSPDDGDALALTFAMPVRPKPTASTAPAPRVGRWS